VRRASSAASVSSRLGPRPLEALVGEHVPRATWALLPSAGRSLPALGWVGRLRSPTPESPLLAFRSWVAMGPPPRVERFHSHQMRESAWKWACLRRLIAERFHLPSVCGMADNGQRRLLKGLRDTKNDKAGGCSTGRVLFTAMRFSSVAYALNFNVKTLLVRVPSAFHFRHNVGTRRTLTRARVHR
jgi:hypothetical protein